MTTVAIQAAVARRGVAALIVPADVFALPIDPALDYRPHFAQVRSFPATEDLLAMAEMLNQGKRIAIYGGSGCAERRDEVIAMTDKLKAPVVRTSRAKDYLEHDNTFDVGMTGALGAQGGHHAINSCDTLLLLGCDFAWAQYYPNKAKIIQLDIDAVHLGRRHPIDLGVSGDVQSTFQAHLPLIAQRDDTTYLDDCLKVAQETQERIMSCVVMGSAGVIHPQYLSALLAKHAPKDAIFTADCGSPMVWLLRVSAF